MLEKYSIRSQILIFFIVLSTVSLFVISALAVGNLITLGNSTRSLATKSLEDQITRNILQSSKETSTVIERKISNAVSVVESIATVTELLFNDSINKSLKYVESYFDFSLPTIPSDATPKDKYRNPISLSHSVYYITDSTPENLSNIMTPEVTDVINRSAHLDTFFSSIFQNNPNFYWLYVGFQDSKVFRVFPGTIWDDDRDYDHTKRFWYKNARHAKGDMIITDPYKGIISNEWMITITRAVFKPDGPFLGVVAGDVLINDIQNRVLNVSFLTSGYAALIQRDGSIVAHPSWDYSTAAEPELLENVEVLILTQIYPPLARKSQVKL
ncbi:MAG: hypothetical protein H8E17_08665, partial [Deltaproteobacteria bacterium]|nr:hypothetical protein [Deltaproteobacteria bacterium]